MTGQSGLHHVLFVAVTRKFQEPGQQTQDLSRLDAESRLSAEHPLDASTDLAGTGQWNHMAGTYVAAITVRTRFAELAFFNQRNIASGLPKIPCGESSDDSTTDDDSMRRFDCHWSVILTSDRGGEVRPQLAGR